MTTQRSAVTLSDIARRTGVSKVTVSSVLNRRDSVSNVRVSEETRQRILAAAGEMGYHPNAVARALTQRRTDTLALVLHSPEAFSGGSGFISALMHGVLEAVNALGYDLMLHTKAHQDTQKEALALTDGRVDGVLLLRDRDDPLAALLEERGFPNVSIFTRPDASTAWSVDSDNVAGGRLAAEYLLGLGHTRIGYVSGPERSAAAADRFDGFRMGMAAAGQGVNPEHFCRLGYAGDDFTPLLAWFGEDVPTADRPTALFVWSDDVARHAMTLLRAVCGLKIPTDVSVVGYDGTEAVCEHSVPRLTSVQQPIHTIAARGVQTLVARIQQNTDTDTPTPERRQLFSPILAERDSCASPLTD